MMKWIKRLIFYPLLVVVFLIILFFLFDPRLYYSLKSFYGSELQWYGYEEKGVSVIESSFAKLGDVPASTFHAASIQNTKNGNYDQAIDYLEKAVALEPDEADEYYGWVLLYYYRDYKKALFHLERADKRTPSFTEYVGDVNIIYAKGLCYKQLGDYEKAKAYFELAIADELKNHNEEWVTHNMYFHLGRTFHLMGQRERAILNYEKAILKWDGSAESIYYKGIAQIELGNENGCKNLKLALEKVKIGLKTSDSYVRQFDEIYEGQVHTSIKNYCM